MSRARKFYKKYERHVLLGLVILLLATFSVTGALKCQGEGNQKTFQLGGSFQAAPTKRLEVDDTEFDRLFALYYNFQRAIRMPSREFREWVMGLRPPDSFKAAWGHLIGLGAAKEAGYRAGEHQVHNAVRDMVSFALMVRARMEYNDINYRQFLKENFSGSQIDFEDAVREVVIKDQFLKPLVDASRYQVPYPDAYEKWKSSRERVNLEFVALPAISFAETARLDERTRTEISRQDSVLKGVTSAAAQLNRVLARLEAVKKAPEGKYPESLEAMANSGPTPFKVGPDPWGEKLRYKLVDDTPDVRSAGPDMAFDTADDVTADTRKHLDTHSNAFELATKINQRRNAAGSWPATLADLLKSPGEERLPSLARPIKDGWDRDFEYTAAAGDTPPSITSLGVDGAAGGGDDLTVVLDPDAVRVQVGEGLSAYVLDAKDAWDRPLDIVLSRAQPPIWSISSSGVDGKTGSEETNADDLTTGNEAELKSFFATVQGDFRLEARRRFETVFVHLPLLADETLKTLWEKYPQHRPKDEEDLYKYWRSYRGPEYFYRVEDPRDSEEGHGAELARRIAPDLAAVLVPAKDIFPAVLEAKDDGKDGDKDEPKDRGAEGSPDGSDDAEEAFRKEYAEKGWREIVIREQFVEALLNDILVRVRENRIAIKAAERKLASIEKATKDYEAKRKAWEERVKDLPEADRGPAPEAPKDEKPEVPAEITFESLLASEFAGVVAKDGEAGGIQYWRTPELMTRSEWEANENFGTELQYTLNRLKEDGEYNGIPAQLHRRLTKVLVRRIEFKAEEQQNYDDVKEAVFERFIEKRQMDIAAKNLKRLQDAVMKAETELGEEPTPEARRAAATKAMEAWAERLGRPVYWKSETGLFMGSEAPPSVEVEDDTPEAEARAIRQRNFIWRTGYATVRPTASRQDTVEAKPGTFGRRVLRDPLVKDRNPEIVDGVPKPKDRGTGSVYLVRVKERVYPSKAEFSPRRYTVWLREEVYGPQEARRYEQSLRDLEGRYFQSLARYMDDMDWLQATFDLRTNSELNVLEERRKR